MKLHAPHAWHGQSEAGLPVRSPAERAARVVAPGLNALADHGAGPGVRRPQPPRAPRNPAPPTHRRRNGKRAGKRAHKVHLVARMEMERQRQLQETDKAKANQSSLPYDPITLMYDDGNDGERLKYYDDKVRVRLPSTRTCFFGF